STDWSISHTEASEIEALSRAIQSVLAETIEHTCCLANTRGERPCLFARPSVPERCTAGRSPVACDHRLFALLGNSSEVLEAYVVQRVLFLHFADIRLDF